MPVLLPYSANTLALSSVTAQVIKGSEPYFTFDGGITKATTTEDLLGITLSNGTTITPANNTSMTIPIMLPKTGETLENVQMSIPTSTDSITLNSLIGAPNNYWGDDDGDGQGINGITVTGNLSVSITDRENHVVSRSATLDICKGPYKVILTTDDGNLTTQYGVPNNRSFKGSSVTYYINPQAAPVICYARPVLREGAERYAGPTNIWNPYRGFFVKSTIQSSYSSNFPTTGANNLYFDLDIGGSGPLNWPTVTRGGITATMKPTPGVIPVSSSIRVTFTGPTVTPTQVSSDLPGLLSKPSLPQEFELVGYDSNNKAVLKYGFVLRQWFVHRGDKEDNVANQSSWCSNLGYRMSKVKDFTNAVCRNVNAGTWCQGSEGVTPSSIGNHYQRNIGAGFFSEWGVMSDYIDAGFVYYYIWTSDPSGTGQFDVSSFNGGVGSDNPTYSHSIICTYP